MKKNPPIKSIREVFKPREESLETVIKREVAVLSVKLEEKAREVEKLKKLKEKLTAVLKDIKH